MINSIIIEDEKPAARRLKKLVQELDINVLETLDSVEASKDWLSSNPQPDLLFLDIQLSDGLSFDIFETIELNSAIIFTTAYDEYALRAFKLNSIDYLLKPIDKDELSNAILKYKNQTHKSKIDIEAIKTLFLNHESLPKTKERFTVKVGDHIKLVELQDIQCFYSHDKATFLMNAEGKRYILDSSLDDIYAQINPINFFKISRKFIVNINYIEELIAYSNSRLRVVLKSKLEVLPIVSRERVKEFKAWLS
jgi:DNA-binding LytR/AlgR family response regulator